MVQAKNVRLTLAVLSLLAGAAQANAQISWVTPAQALSGNPVWVASPGQQLCRAAYLGPTYTGGVLGGQCSIAVGTSEILVSTYEVAVGLGKWDSPSQKNPVAGGNFGSTLLYPCRVDLGNGNARSGWSTGGGNCTWGKSGAVVSSTSFQLLFAFDPSAYLVILAKDGGMCVGANLVNNALPAAGPVNMTYCRTSNFGLQLWQLRPSGGDLYQIVLSNPSASTEVCISASVAPNATACSSAGKFHVNWTGERTVSLVSEVSGSNLVYQAGIHPPHDLAFGNATQAYEFELRSPGEEANHFQIMNYNVMLLPTAAYPGMRSPLRAQWIPDSMYAAGVHPDVLVIEEGFDNPARWNFNHSLLPEYPYYTGVPSFPVKLMNGGVFIQSRWLIERFDYRVYTDSAGADLIASKGVTYALINKLGKRYHVFATHLQADGIAGAGEVRTLQLNQLRAFIYQTVRPYVLDPFGVPTPIRVEEPIIICGDLNIDMEDYNDFTDMLTGTNARFVQAPRPAGSSTGFPVRWTTDPDVNQIADERGASAAWLDYILFNQWSRADLNLTEVSYLVRAFRLNVPYAMDVRPSLNSPNRLYTDLTDHSSLTGTFRFKDAVPTWVAAPSTPVFFNAVDFHFVDIPFAQATITSGLYPLPATLPLTTGQAFDVSIDDEIAGDPGTRYRFNNWSDGGARTHTFTAGAALTKLTAQFQTQHELTIKVTPANGGSVSGAGWYNQGVAAVMTATPAPGYHFAGYSTTLGNTNPLSLLMNGPLQVTATFMQDGPPSLYAAASGVRTDGAAPGTRRVPISIVNSGPNTATNPRITGITGISVLTGTGTVSTITGMPIILRASLPSGIEAQTPIDFNWPATASRVRFTVQFDADGYTGSTTLTLFR